jgi:hypothetical protein
MMRSLNFAALAAAALLSTPALAADARQTGGVDTRGTQRVQEPFQAYVSAGVSHENNLFRLPGSTVAQEALGDDGDDWYRYAEAGFRALHSVEDGQFEFSAAIRRQTYDTFDFLDHNAGAFAASGTWKLTAEARGNLGYTFRRRLQPFTNKDTTARDVVQEHRVDGGVERPLGDRWLARLGASATDLAFSTTEALDKRRYDGNAEIHYAASQLTTIGLVTTYTRSDFDVDGTRDFSGWSIGPSWRWQPTARLLVSSNVGYTHRSLDNGAGEIDDYDGVTGFLSGQWSPTSVISSELRVYRDVSNLGGEISEYTERTGIQLTPQWHLTPKVTSRLSLGFERRDFSAVQTDAINRKDDYFLADLAVDFAATSKLLLGLGYGYENRDSNVGERDFSARMLHAHLRWDI